MADKRYKVKIVKTNRDVVFLHHLNEESKNKVISLYTSDTPNETIRVPDENGIIYVIRIDRILDLEVSVEE